MIPDGQGSQKLKWRQETVRNRSRHLFLKEASLNEVIQELLSLSHKDEEEACSGKATLLCFLASCQMNLWLLLFILALLPNRGGGVWLCTILEADWEYKDSLHIYSSLSFLFFLLGWSIWRHHANVCLEEAKQVTQKWQLSLGVHAAVPADDEHQEEREGDSSSPLIRRPTVDPIVPLIQL